MGAPSQSFVASPSGRGRNCAAIPGEGSALELVERAPHPALRAAFSRREKEGRCDRRPFPLPEMRDDAAQEKMDRSGQKPKSRKSSAFVISSR